MKNKKWTLYSRYADCIGYSLIPDNMSFDDFVKAVTIHKNEDSKELQCCLPRPIRMLVDEPDREFEVFKVIEVDSEKALIYK